MRATWLLERAGYKEVVKEHEVGGGAPWLPKKKISTRRWELTGEPAGPLPNRQEIEASHKDAIMPASELEETYTSMRAAVAKADGGELSPAMQATLDALPCVSVSHCWELATHPDPECRTLQRVAEALAGTWAGPQSASPISGLPLFRAWGAEDVAVFFDWASLYQKPRTALQDASFSRALASMSLWYAAKLTTVLLIWDQDAHLSAPRAKRGWPFYEERMATLFKDAAPPGFFKLPDAHGGLRLWSKVIHVTDSRDAAEQGDSWSTPTRLGNHGVLHVPRDGVPAPETSDSKRQKGVPSGSWSRAHVPRDGAVDTVDCSKSRASTHRQGPPLSPSRFAEELSRRQFTNGADLDVVQGLYSRTLAEGFSELSELNYPLLGWTDDDVATLLETLREVAHPHITWLNLSSNYDLTDASLSALGRAIGDGALKGLQGLYLGDVPQFHTLPAELGSLRSLTLLDLGGTELTSLPDLSSLPAGQLQVKGLPVELAKTWDGVGRKALGKAEVAQVMWIEYGKAPPDELKVELATSDERGAAHA
jgi:hypothetical protein